MPNDVLHKLHEKFASNISASVGDPGAYASAETRLRCLPVVHDLLRAPSNTPHQQELLTLFDELFADGTASLYLSATGLQMAARMLLRRVLEIGVAVVYLWDLPHEFWGWHSHDKDLSFKRMITHLGDEQYKTFVSRDGAVLTGGAIIDGGAAENLYGALSDTVHGKYAQFSIPLAKRFEFSAAEWHGHGDLVNGTLKTLIALYESRFVVVRSSLSGKMPQLQILAKEGK
jgi:hypothetical protein